MLLRTRRMSLSNDAATRSDGLVASRQSARHCNALRTVCGPNGEVANLRAKLVVAAQAIDFRALDRLGCSAAAIHELIRTIVPRYATDDRSRGRGVRR
jgi:histidine ammonia-lyase